MAMLAPDVAILDETDSGLDIDALRTVAEGVQRLHDEQGLGALIITHYQRILHYVKPEFVHILMDGRIVLQGGVELVERLEREGYDQIRQEVGATCLRFRSSLAATARRASTTRSQGAGAGNGRTLEQLREAALRTYETSELPVWRRSGFWTTSLQSLDLDALQTGGAGDSIEVAPGVVPDVVTRTLPDRPHAGRIVQSAGSVVHVELDPALAERGVILCSLEDAFRDHRELAEHWYSKRLTIDRHKLEAANAAFWTGGAFLYVPKGVVVEDPFEIVYAIDAPGRGAVRAHARDRRRAAASSACTSTTSRRTSPGPGAARGRVRAVPAGRRALPPGAACRTGARARSTTSRRASSASDATRTATGCRRCSGGHLVRQHLELAVSEPGGDMAFRGLFFTEEHEHLDVFAVDLHETGPSGGDVHWRGAATGESRASFEGLIQIDPGAQQTHTYLQIHSMMLSPKARVDAIPSVLVSADDVSASHGGTVGELDEAAIFYMQSRGLDRPAAVRVIVEGFFEPLIAELRDEPLEELVRAKIAGKLAAAREDIEAYATSR